MHPNTAAVLQVVAAQVLERAGDAALERHSGVSRRARSEAVRCDGELTQLVGDEALAEGGLPVAAVGGRQ